MLKPIITWGLLWPIRGVWLRPSATIPPRSSSDPAMSWPTIILAFSWPGRASSPRPGNIFPRYCSSIPITLAHADSLVPSHPDARPCMQRLESVLAVRGRRRYVFLHGESGLGRHIIHTGHD